MNHTQPLFASLFAFSLLSAGTISSVTNESSLVVYSSDLALVHENRNTVLERGKQALVYSGVASSLIPESVNVTFPQGVTLYSQQYRFDQVTTQKLAEAHLGKEVKFYFQNGSGLVYKNGTLLSAGTNVLVKTAQNEIYTLPLSSLIFSDIPNTLITSPSLLWNIDVAKQFNGALSLDYLTKNISWKCDYRLDLSKNRANLNGWITVDNRSGKAFTDTKLSLLAGDINRAAMPLQRRYAAMAASAEMDGPSVQEFSRNGYHLYHIPFKVSLAENENTQIKFLQISDLPVTRGYEVQLNDPLHMQGEVRHSAGQYLEFKSLEKALPKGIVRTYSKERGETLLLGETLISNTPAHEGLRVKYGSSFDLLVTEKLVSDNSDRYYIDRKVSYVIANRSNEPKRLQLLIPFVRRDDAQSSIESTQKYQWKNGNLLAFDLQVGEESTKEVDVHYRSKR